MTVSGFTESGYEAVRDVFQDLFDSGSETGAAVSVWADGHEVVGLQGGWIDPEDRYPWQPDTLVHTYSTSKPFASLTALWVVAQGAADLDAPVCRYWADYGVEGKERTTLRDVLTHRAGQPAFPAQAADVDLLADDDLRRILAAAAPDTAPGTVLAEHALTYGHLIDGVLRGATGRSLQQIYLQDVRPVLDFDGWFGVPNESLSRVADVEHALAGGPEQFVRDVHPTYDRLLRYPYGVLEPARLNSADWRQAAFGAVNLHASARSLAQLYSTLDSPTGPVRALLGEDLHREFLTSQICDLDRTVGLSVNWTLGPLRTDNFVGLGGLGGSAAWKSLRKDHGVAYVTRRLHDHSRVAQIAAVLGDDIHMEYVSD